MAHRVGGTARSERPWRTGAGAAGKEWRLARPFMTQCSLVDGRRAGSARRAAAAGW